MLNEKMLKAQLFQQLYMIGRLNEKAMEQAWKCWDAMDKPRRSLGLLEKAVVKMAGIQGTPDVKMDKKAIVVMGTDSSQDRRLAAVKVMASKNGTDIFVVDMEMYKDGTGNIAEEPAMAQTACIQAVLRGIEEVGELTEQGYTFIGVGEMYNENAIASSALVSVLLNLPADEVTSRSAEMSDEAWKNKIAAIEQAVSRYWKATEESTIPEGQFFKVETAIELMAHLGSPDIAGMVGLCLGGAIFDVPIVLDGYISEAAALCAALINRESTEWLLASQLSGERAELKVLRNLHLEPVIYAGMHLGEGTGAAAAMGLYDMGWTMYRELSVQ